MAAPGGITAAGGPAPFPQGRTPDRTVLTIIALVLAVAVVVATVVLLAALPWGASTGCGSGLAYRGPGVCLQLVGTAVSAFGAPPPSASASCPSLLAVNTSFVCWLNLTSTSGTPQNLTNVSIGGSGSPFTLVSVSNPLPLVLGPGQVVVERLTIDSPTAPGSYNLLLSASLVAA